MAPFQHKPIDLDGRSFRLFRLFKGECGSLEGELFDAWLQDTEGLIEYEALSYTWGGSYKPQDVTIDGKLMLVTTNLFRALQHLRCRNRDRILWIDAICIDQTNEKERGHQVQQMTDIYRTAERVLIWLGQSTPETDTVFDHMLQLARDATKYACKHWVASDKRWMEIWSSVQPPSGHAHGDLRAEERKGFEIILRRPWFKRVWIIQEVANARSAQIVCGTKSVSAHIFAVTPALLEVKPPPHYQAILDIMPGPTRAWSWWNRKHDLHTLLLKFGGSEASDPRDMVYALLGISSDGGSTDTLVPDYEKSLRRVIHDTLAFLLRLDNGKCSRPPLPPWTLPDLLQDLESLGNATIMWAAKTGQEALVMSLLPDKADANTKDSGMRTPLLLAAENGHEAIVELLLANEADVNCKSEDMQTPTSVAAENGRETIVRLLLANKADTNTIDKRGETPLSLAVGHRHKAIVKLLLANKADVNLGDKMGDHSRGIYGQPPLCSAVSNRDEAMVNLLLAKKANVNALNKSARTPLWFAVQNRDQTLVKLLLGIDNIDPDHSKTVAEKTPFALAVEKGDEAIVKLLLDTKQVDVNWRNTSEQTSLFVAAKNGHGPIVKLLLSSPEVETDIQDKFGWKLLWKAAQNGHDAIVKLLLQSEDPDKQKPVYGKSRDKDVILCEMFLDIWKAPGDDFRPKSPLWWAALNRHNAVFRLLLETGNVDVHTKDHDGATLLEWAASCGRDEVVRLLLNPHISNFDVTMEKYLPQFARRNGYRRTVLQTALLHAIQYGHEGVLRMLLETGKADINLKDSYGERPLVEAARVGNERVFELLLTLGHPDINLEGSGGDTSLLRAVKYGHVGVVKLLLDTGKADTELKDRNGRTLRDVAASCGYDAIVKLLDQETLSSTAKKRRWSDLDTE